MWQAQARGLLFLSFLALIPCLQPTAMQAATSTWPDLMNYQGLLTDASGSTAVADGSYSILFSIYAQSSGGSALWSETQSVTTTKGLFYAVLGSVNPLSGLALSAYLNDLWVGVTVGADAEMTPRHQLLPAPYARNAKAVGGLLPNNTANNLLVLDSSGKVPAGLVQPGSLSVPFDLNGATATYNLNVSNTSAAPAALGLKASGSNAAFAQATDAGGYGVWGRSAAVDGAAGVGVRGSASNGTGVLAQSVASVALSATTQSSSAPSIYAAGAFPGRFLANAAVAGNAALTAATESGDYSAALSDRGNSAGVYSKVSASGAVGVSASASAGSAVFARTSSNSAGDYGVWGAYAGASASGTGVYGSGAVGVYGSGSSLGVSGSGATAGVAGVGNIGVQGQTSQNGGMGVRGDAAAGYPTALGVLGTHAAAVGVAVEGRHLGAGAGMGLKGGSASGVGAVGVYGSVSGTGGAAGLQGFAAAADGYGIYGLQGSSSPVTYAAGVLGRAASLFVGIGVRGEGNQGVYGLSSGRCGVCAYNQNTVSGYPAAGLYANSPYNAVLAESTNTGNVGYGVYSTIQSTYNTSAAGYFLAQGSSGVTAGVYAANSSAEGRAVHALAAVGGVNYYSDPANQPAYGFYHADANPPPNGVGVYSVENCSDCYSGDFINTAAQAGVGAALNVQGRMRVQFSAGTFVAPDQATTYVLNNSYIISTCLIFLTSRSDTLSLAAVTSVGNGTATVSFSPKLSGNTTYQYIIIGQ